MKKSKVIRVILSLVLSLILLIPLSGTAKAATSLSIDPPEIHVYSPFTLLGTGYMPGQTVYWGMYVYDHYGNLLHTIGWGYSTADANGCVVKEVPGGIASLLYWTPPESVGSVKFEAGVPGVGRTHLYVNLLPYQPPSPIDDLTNLINDLLLPSGLENSLISTLENVQKSIDNGNEKTALNQLNAMKHKIEAQRGKSITGEEAYELLLGIQFIICDITGEPPPSGGA